MLKKMVSLSLVLTFTFLGSLGCAAKKAPDCSDDKTKELVLKKILIHPAYVGAKSKGHTTLSEEEYEKDFLAKTNLSYSNNELIATFKETPDQKLKLYLSDTRTINLIKDIGKYECAAEFKADIIDKGQSSEFMPKQEITYTSELADNGKKHFVGVKMVSTGSF